MIEYLFKNKVIDYTHHAPTYTESAASVFNDDAWKPISNYIPSLSFPLPLSFSWPL